MNGKLMVILWMLLSQVLAALSQVLLKKGADRSGETLIRQYLNPQVMGGYGMLLLSMLCSVLAFRHADRFMQVPVMEGLGFVLVLILARVLFGERITLRKAAGMGFILGGILLYYLVG